MVMHMTTTATETAQIVFHADRTATIDGKPLDRDSALAITEHVPYFTERPDRLRCDGCFHPMTLEWWPPGGLKYDIGTCSAECMRHAMTLGCVEGDERKAAQIDERTAAIAELGAAA